MKIVTYAGQKYEVIYHGKRVLYLRSLRDPDLVIHCSVRSALLKDFGEEEAK